MDRLNPWGAALAPIYHSGAGIRNFLYDAGILDAIVLPSPVISVGNLTMGGTGKTPFTQMLVNHLIERRKKVALVGRNYKSRSVTVSKVDPKRKDAALFFGDEPTLLAQKNPGVSVYVGPRKWQAACLAFEMDPPDCVIVDDGFQHRSLYRNLDFVLMDATAPLLDYKIFPRGKARESLNSLKRADFIVLSKVNLVEESKIAALQALLPADIPILQISYRLESPVEEAGFKVMAVAGIAKPETFHQSLKLDTLYDVVGQLNFPDHHPFQVRDLNKMKAEMIKAAAQLIVMTDKDYVKIGPMIQTETCDLRPEDIRVLPLRTFFLDSTAKFDEALDRLFAPA